MYKFELKRLSDNLITHTQTKENIDYVMEIPKGWGYHHLVEDVDSIIIEELNPNSFEIVITNLQITDMWSSLKLKRNEYLKNTDFSQLADAPFSSEEKLEYRQYRTYLRDLPAQYNNDNITSYVVLTFEQWKNQ